MNIFFAKICPSSGQGIIDPTHLPQTCAKPEEINTVFHIVYAIIGAMVLFFVVLAGARYTFSKGEPEAIQKAKNELKYALIGLIIVSVAAAVVRFITGRL